MPVKRQRRSNTNWEARRFRGDEIRRTVPSPTVNYGEPMPKPDSKGKVLPPAGEPVTDIRIYPA